MKITTRERDRLGKALRMRLIGRLPTVQTLMPQTEKEVDVAIEAPQPGAVDLMYTATLTLAAHVKVKDSGNEITNIERATDMAIDQYSEYLHQPVIYELVAIRKQVLSLSWDNNANSDCNERLKDITAHISNLIYNLISPTKGGNDNE